jgi:putative intracellular protease/amidase
MKILFLVSSAEMGFWLAELTHPFWHFAERGNTIDFASPKGGKVVWGSASDPYSKDSQEVDDLVSKGFLSDKALVARLNSTIALTDVRPEQYDAVHVVGGGGAAIDLYPNPEVARILEHFWSANKLVGAICHGVIALGNNPGRVAGRRVTGFSRAEDAEIEISFGANFIPNFPQPVLEKVGAQFSHVEPWGLQVVVDGKLVTGQNQMSASEYAIAFNHVLDGRNPVQHG